MPRNNNNNNLNEIMGSDRFWRCCDTPHTHHHTTHRLHPHTHGTFRYHTHTPPPFYAPRCVPPPLCCRVRMPCLLPLPHYPHYLPPILDIAHLLRFMVPREHLRFYLRTAPRATFLFRDAPLPPSVDTHATTRRVSTFCCAFLRCAHHAHGFAARCYLCALRLRVLKNVRAGYARFALARSTTPRTLHATATYRDSNVLRLHTTRSLSAWLHAFGFTRGCKTRCVAACAPSLPYRHHAAHRCLHLRYRHPRATAPAITLLPPLRAPVATPRRCHPYTPLDRIMVSPSYLPDGSGSSSFARAPAAPLRASPACAPRHRLNARLLPPHTFSAAFTAYLRLARPRARTLHALHRAHLAASSLPATARRARGAAARCASSPASRIALSITSAACAVHAPTRLCLRTAPAAKRAG